MNRRWYETCANDMYQAFPGVSEEGSASMWEKTQGHVIRSFADKWPRTRTAICSIIAKRSFTGPMLRIKSCVSSCWSSAWMENAQRILGHIRSYPQILEVIPELQSEASFLQELLRLFKRLGGDALYMKLLFLPEEDKASREQLALHAAAEYALGCGG
ncbi:hypothetical protein MRX96_034244 [Rhipicephalus microplus]